MCTCGHLVSLHKSCAPVQSLPPEDSAEGAVILVADGPHNIVHRPAIELLVRQDLQRDKCITCCVSQLAENGETKHSHQSPHQPRH